MFARIRGGNQHRHRETPMLKHNKCVVANIEQTLHILYRMCTTRSSTKTFSPNTTKVVQAFATLLLGNLGQHVLYILRLKPSLQSPPRTFRYALEVNFKTTRRVILMSCTISLTRFNIIYYLPIYCFSDKLVLSVSICIIQTKNPKCKAN